MAGVLAAVHFRISVPSAVMSDIVPASVPPRVVAPSGVERKRAQTIVRNQDYRQLLIGMGFPKHRA